MSNEKDEHIIGWKNRYPPCLEKTRGELMRLQRMVESKIPLGEEITVVVLETN